MSYEPTKKVKAIIDRAWQHIQSVNYKVSIRWVFYKLLQEGYFSSKSGYNNLKGYLSTARKRFYGGWRPDTLADETRQATYRGFGYETEEQAVATFPNLANKIDTRMGHFFKQENYVELWFEAKAMIGQFEYYSKDITLRPFGGDPSIPYKFKAAMEMAQHSRYYGKPAVVVYFGDYDKKGLEILDSAMLDIQAWSPVTIKYERYGLTLQQVQQFNIPQNPDKPGDYQWEAVGDTEAEQLILDALGKYLDLNVIDDCKAETNRLKDKWKPIVQELLEDIWDEY